MDVKTEATSSTSDLSSLVCDSPVPSIVITDTDQSSSSPPVERRRLASTSATVDTSGELANKNEKEIDCTGGKDEPIVKSGSRRGSLPSRRENLSSIYARRRSSSSSVDSASSGSRRNSGISDDECGAESRLNQKIRKSSSAESLAVAAFLQYGRRDRRASANALEILKTVCEQRTAVIGGLGSGSESSLPRSRSPSPAMSNTSTSCPDTADDVPDRVQQRDRRSLFSPVQEIDSDPDGGENLGKGHPKERCKSLSSLMAVVQVSKQYSRLNQCVAGPLTIKSERKSTPSRKNSIETFSTVDAAARMGRRMSVSTIDVDLNKSYPPKGTQRAGSSLDRGETPRGDSVVPSKEKLLSGRASVSNNLTDPAPSASDMVVLQDDIVRLSATSAARKPSISTSYTRSPPPNRKFTSQDNGTKSNNLYTGPPSNCQARADSKTAGARLKRHLGSVYSRMTTAERLQVEAERQRLNRASVTAVVNWESHLTGNGKPPEK